MVATAISWLMSAVAAAPPPPEVDQAPLPAERQHGRRGDGGDARKRAQAGLEFAHAIPDLLATGVLIPLQRDPEGHRLFGREARRHPRHLDEAANEQSGAGEQHDRERHLRHDQRGAHAVGAAARRPATAALAQRPLSRAARRLQRREQTESQAGDEGDTEGEEHDGAVQADGLEPRNVGRLSGHQRPGRPVGDHQADDAAGKAEDDRLGQQLPEQPAAAGPHRHADRELTLTRRRTRQQQVGDVRAGDQQHQADRTEQHEERPLHVTDDHVAQRSGGKRKAGVRVRKGALQPAADASASRLPPARRSTPGRARPMHVEVFRRAAPWPSPS